MAMNTVYTHTCQGRRLTTWIGLVIGGSVTPLALMEAEHWYLGVPPALAALMCGYAVIRNPVSGMRLDADSFSYFSNNRHQSIACAEIDRVRIESWTDSDTVTLVRKGGDAEILPSLALPNTAALTAALSAHGIPVEHV
jgi:hypothetical protein